MKKPDGQNIMLLILININNSLETDIFSVRTSQSVSSHGLL